MGKNEDTYWQQWQKLLEAAANFQELLTGSVMIGGSAAAVHLKHRYSFDADHILSDLKEKYEEVLDFLEGRDDWETARIHPPKLILGNFQGVETGVRQLRRNRPLETQQIQITGKTLTIASEKNAFEIVSSIRAVNPLYKRNSAFGCSASKLRGTFL